MMQPTFGTLERSPKILRPKISAISSGTWIARFHDPGQSIDERIKIVQSGHHVTATKVTGESYIPAGKVTFQGAFTTNPFEAKSLCAHKGVFESQ